MFGDRLKLIRKNNNLTQSELSQKLGVSQGHISALEKNEKKPGGEILVSLKRYFDVDLNWLLIGKGDSDLSKNQDTQRKFAIIDEIEEWLGVEVEKDPETEIWFRMQIKKTVPGFKEWIEEKEDSEATKDNSSTRKVA